MLKLHIPDMTCGSCNRNIKLIQVNGSAPEAGNIRAIEDVGFTVNRIVL